MKYFVWATEGISPYKELLDVIWNSNGRDFVLYGEPDGTYHVIVKVGNHKYVNEYDVEIHPRDKDSYIYHSSAKWFDTLAEADEMLRKHRPQAEKITSYL